jgi:hypothetical protein
MSPLWIPAIPALVCAVLAVALLRRPRRPRGRAVRLLAGLVMVVLALSLGALSLTLMQFKRLAEDVPVAVITVQELAPQQFTVHLRADGIDHDFPLFGDQWQLDAQVVRWQLPALLSGAPPVYRLDRLSGRYANAGDELERPRSAHALARGPVPGIGELRRSYPRWLPFVDARWGSAAFLPMIDGARYEVAFNPRGGLVARPADADTERLLREAGW